MANNALPRISSFISASQRAFGSYGFEAVHIDIPTVSATSCRNALAMSIKRDPDAYFGFIFVRRKYVSTLVILTNIEGLNQIRATLALESWRKWEPIEVVHHWVSTTPEAADLTAKLATSAAQPDCTRLTFGTVNLPPIQVRTVPKFQKDELGLLAAQKP